MYLSEKVQMHWKFFRVGLHPVSMAATCHLVSTGEHMMILASVSEGTICYQVYKSSLTTYESCPSILTLKQSHASTKFFHQGCVHVGLIQNLYAWGLGLNGSFT